jgi:hypothetical protein
MVWTAQCQRAFDALKKALCGAWLVMHPDFSLPFVLYTDASKVATAGVLTQYRPVVELENPLLVDHKPQETGRRRLADGQAVREVVVGYFSKLNSELDSKMGATALECLAVVLALNHSGPMCGRGR